MKIEKFWNSAFPPVLARLPAEEAKVEADKATEVCNTHWQNQALNWAPPEPKRWQSMDICRLPFSTEQLVERQRSVMSKCSPAPRSAQGLDVLTGDRGVA